MRPTHHWHLFCLATTWWTLFFIFGLPSNYFQGKPFWLLLIVGDVLPAFALAYFGWRRCSRHAERAWSSALWIAFWFTLPLFCYDYLYLAEHQQRGWSFLQSHWYLTAFYIIPWLILPPIAWWVTTVRGSTRRAG